MAALVIVSPDAFDCEGENDDENEEEGAEQAFRTASEP